MIDTILWDLDGVCADLHKALFEETGVTEDEFSGMEIKSRDKFFFDWFEPFVEKGGVSRLDPMPGFEDLRFLMYTLMNRGYDVRICSSITSNSYSDKIQEQKEIWLTKHLLHEHIFPRIFPKGSGMKAQHAAPNIVLVDDSKHAGLPFQEAGGKWIKHINVEDTYTKLIGLLEVENGRQHRSERS